MPTIIPVNNDAKIVFFEMFRKHFVLEAENLNFSAAETEKVLSACDTVVFSVHLTKRAKAFSKACHSFRTAKFTGRKPANVSEYVPTFDMPTLPAVMFQGNAIGYLQRMFTRIKAQSGYSEMLGIAMGIVPTKAAPRNLNEAKPKGKASALPNNAVRIDWKKGKFDGVIVYSKRGDEAHLTKLERDVNPPFIDTRPPLEAGKPELRQYQLIYFVNDEPVGQASDIMQITTIV